MGYALKNIRQKLVPQAQRSLAFGSITGSYALVGSVFTEPVLLLYIMSTLDQPVQLSFDGTNDHMPIFANGFIIFDEAMNGLILDGAKGVYVKEIGNPTTGNLYVSCFGVS